MTSGATPSGSKIVCKRGRSILLHSKRPAAELAGGWIKAAGQPSWCTYSLVFPWRGCTGFRSYLVQSSELFPAVVADGDGSRTLGREGIGDLTHHAAGG